MAIPDYQTLMLPVLEAAADGETRVAELAEKIAKKFGLSAAECEELLPSGRQRILHNRIHWAKFYLSKAGLVTMPYRGRFIATDVGKAVIAKHPDKLDNEFLLRFPAFRDFFRGEKTTEPDDEATKAATTDTTLTPIEQIEAAAAILRSSIRAEILDRVIANSPGRFEQLIVDLLVAMGYGGSHEDARKQLGGSGDGGVDGVINEDRLGLDRIYIQAKRYGIGNTVGRPDIQSFVGALAGVGASKGVFVSTSSFSQQARDYARANLTHRVILIDGETLADLMIEHGVGVRISRTITLHDIDSDFFTDPD